MKPFSLATAKRAACLLAFAGALAPAARAHVTLNSPNGGEVLIAGSVEPIEWQILIAHNLQNWDLEYSTNGLAGPFVPVVTDYMAGSPVVGVLHTYNWTVPNTPSTQVLVRVTMDNSAIDYSDVSATVFTIVAADPFASFCSGDGGNQLGCTNCPCGNNAAPGTTGGCLNSAGTSTRLIASGDASVSLPAGSMSDLRFSLSGAPSAAFCILNSGDALAPTNGANMCFGQDSGTQAAAFDGLRCAVVNTRRHGGRSADTNGEVGATNSPWGGEGGPPVGIAQAGGGFASGQTRYFQVIHRDDALLSCQRGLNTTQAIEVTFEP